MRGSLRWALGVVFAGLLAAGPGPAVAQAFSGFSSSDSSSGAGLFGIFDEVRLGTVFSIQPDDDSGVIVSGQIYSRQFVRPFDNYFANTLLRPRVHVGGNLATAEDGVSQVYGGLTWHFPVYDPFFLEASFGGTRHDGPLASHGGLNLGCHWLFRESLGIGFDLGEHWRVLASVDHSSHAHLCKDGKTGNSGITHAGAYIGYRF